MDSMQTNIDSLFRFGGIFFPQIIERAKGSYVYDTDGRAILDFTSGQMSSILGHSHPEIVETVCHAIANLDHLSSSMISTPVIQLADALVDLLPEGLDRVMLLSTGGEATEAAIKMAKTATGRYESIAFSKSYHGSTAGAAALTYSTGRRQGINMPGQYILPTPQPLRTRFRKPDGSHDWEAELDFGFELIDVQATEAPAFMIAETLLSAGGVIELPPGYLKALKAHCDRRGILLIIDEAQTGLGRLGDMFGFEQDGVVPDILTLSKTLGVGLPLSAIITSNEIEQACFERGFLYQTTHTSDPLPAAVGLKVIEIVLRDRLKDRAKIAGERLKKGFLEMKDRYEIIGDVRGRGLMVGVEIVKNRESFEPDDEMGQLIGEKAMARGLSANITNVRGMSNVFRIAPPLTVTDEEIDKGLSIFEDALRDAIGSNSSRMRAAS